MQRQNTYRLKSLAIQLLPVVQLQVIALILHHLRDVLTPEDPESSDRELSLRILEDAHHTKGVLAHIVYSLQEAANLPHSTYWLLTLLVAIKLTVILELNQFLQRTCTLSHVICTTTRPQPCKQHSTVTGMQLLCCSFTATYIECSCESDQDTPAMFS